jgi:hypothetical protein
MIRKNALSLALAAIVALTMLVGFPAMNAIVANDHADTIYASDVPTFTATPGASADSNPSGGGNGGG